MRVILCGSHFPVNGLERFDKIKKQIFNQEKF